MAIKIISPEFSFVRFGDPAPVPDCIFGDVDFCLPVFDASDVAFQWVIEGTPEEVDELCTLDGSEVVVSIVSDCESGDLLVFSEKPQRFRLSDTQVLYNWPHGVTGFASVVSVGKCFQIKITYGDVSACTNCFERVGDDCYTSVLEYGSNNDSFGFKYCYGGDIVSPPADNNCEPTVVQFVDVPTVSIPYTAGLRAKYGDVPTVQIWVANGMGELENIGVSASFDTFPVGMINIDFGGNASGIIVIR